MVTKLRVAAEVVLLVLTSARARADVVLEWNELAMKTMVMQGQSPFAQARTAAIVQLAVFEAVNAASKNYEPYLGIVAPVNTSADAAAVAAAYRMLKSYSHLRPIE